jgi:hypothetical protein
MTFQELREHRFFLLSDFEDGFFGRARALEQWSSLASRFDTFERLHAEPATERIPKRIHQIWLGGELPDGYRAWTATWRDVNKGWEYRLWDSEAIREFGLVNERAFRKSPSFGAKSDIARYEILERLGGVYADTDFECLKPFDEIAQRCSFFAGTIFSDAPEINNGLMGSTPGHPLLRRLIENISEPILTRDTGIILARSGPQYLTRHFFLQLGDLGATDVIFPSSYFYPLPNFKKRETLPNERKAYARDWSFAIHYWETSWARPHPLRVFLSRIKRRVLLALSPAGDKYR